MMLLTCKLVMAIQVLVGIKISFQDKISQAPIPFAQLAICGKIYEADKTGELTIDSSEEICDFTAFAFEYNTLEGKIALKGKQSLVFQLEPKVIEMKDFTVKAEKIVFNDAKALVEQAVKNLRNTHQNPYNNLEIQDSISYSLGKEEFLRESRDYRFVSKDSKLLEIDLSKTIMDAELYDKLQSIIAGPFGGPINQKVKEYSMDRTDLLANQDCDYFKSLACYFQSFFSTQRAISLNPYFFVPAKSQKLDHYGYFNSDFLTTHNFKLLGIDTVQGRPSYVIRIVKNRKSNPISLGGEPVSDWYDPLGTIWIDVADWALLRIAYRYEFLSRPRFLSPPVNKAEFESGPIYFENILEFKKVDDTYVPFRQYTNEKDRNLRIFYNDVFFEPVYVQHFIQYQIN